MTLERNACIRFYIGLSVGHCFTECNISRYCVRFEVLTALIMKNVVIWDVTLCGTFKNGYFGKTYHLRICFPP
jgi:hypothetical protein